MTKLPPTTFNISSSLFILSTILLSIHSNYVKKNCWKKLIKLYEVTNQQIGTKLDESLKPGWETILLFVIYAIFLILMRVQGHISDYDNDNFVMDLILYIKLSSEYLVITFLMLLLKGFKLVKKRTKFLLSDCSDTSSSINRVTHLTVTKTIFCKKLYKNLYNMTACFNQVFGWLLTATFLQFLLTVLVFAQNFILVMNQQVNLAFSTFLWMTFIFRLVSRNSF